MKPKFKVNDKIRFTNRCQEACPSIIKKIIHIKNLFEPEHFLYEDDFGKIWSEGNLILDSEWRSKNEK
jgi:hypothetical protein